jgi:thiamine biosynthesis lipoprotein
MTEHKEHTKYIDNTSPVIPGMKRFSHEAMATTYEVIIVHNDATYSQQAATAAFNEVDRLEAELSRFIENSDIARINNLPANKPLRLGLDAFDCLQISSRLYTETNRAFDVTIGPLLSCWRNDDGTARTPLQEELELARQHTGMHLLQLNEEEHTIELMTGDVQIDLGGIGKGYAVDKIAELLREWSIEIALISGGYSSVLALDTPADTKGWPLSLSNPANRKQILSRPFLQNRALSGSGIRKGLHIIDPRTMQPVSDNHAAWSSAPDAATADALSTAFMIMTTDEIEQYCNHHKDITALVIPCEPEKENQDDNILRFGQWEESETAKS